MNRLKKFKLYFAITSFLFSLLISCLVISILEGNEKRLEKERATHIGEAHIGMFKNVLNSYLYDTEILEMFIIINNGSMKNFDYVSRRLFHEDKVLRAVQLAPKGIVTESYPLVGNQRGFVNLLTDPSRKKDAIYSKETGNMIISGPVKLFQGGRGLIARKPIFIKDKNNNEQFWGFSIVVLNFDELLKATNLEKLGYEGYSYKLTKLNPNSNNTQTVIENINSSFLDPLKLNFTISNDKWVLYLKPNFGWNRKCMFYLRYTVGLALSSLVGLLVYTFLRINNQRKEMQHISITDHLTKLNNGRNFEEIMDHLIEWDRSFSIFYFDLNDFKIINDTFGHHIGDLFLIEIARRIKEVLPSNGTAFRIGGDEFSAILKGPCTQEVCEDLIDKIKSTVSAPFKAEDSIVTPSISCGYSISPYHGKDKEILIRTADKKMYNDKMKYKKGGCANL